MARKNWTRAEQIQALELYLRTPFGRIHNRNPDILNLSKVIGRTANAVALKMVNFAALDPTIHQKGMGNYSKSDAALWAEFFTAPSSFLNSIPSALNADLYEQESSLASDFEYEMREGTEIFRNVRTRKNQDYFRKMILVSYGGRCGLTGIANPELLLASHIVPWSKNIEARLDPRNGVLLNALHDRAFDKGYITFEDDLTMIVSDKLDLPSIARPFFEYERLQTPERFAPDTAYLNYHRDNVFESFL